MSALFALIRHSLRRRRFFLLAAYGVLFAFQLLVAGAARSVEESGAFPALGRIMPGFMQEWTGIMMSSFRGLVLLGYTHPLVVLFLVAIVITTAAECAEESETRFVDVIMARPLARHVAINRSVIVIALAVAGAIGCMMLGTWTGLRLFKPETVPPPAASVILSLGLELGMIGAAWAGVALAVASASHRRATAAAVSGLLAVSTFILAILGSIWKSTEFVARASPFHYYHPSLIVGGATIHWSDAAVLSGIAIVGCLIAHVVYAKRDL